MIVLSSAENVLELFDKRGAIYSSRPHSYLGQELICKDETHLLLMEYTPAWRHLRKVFMSVLNINTVQSLRPIQQAEAAQSMKQICDDPDNFAQHIRRYASSVILSSVFGRRGPSFHDHDVQELYRVQDEFSEILQPGNTPPADMFTFLKYIPTSMAEWKQRAAAVRKGQQDLYLGLLAKTKKRVERGEFVNCFMDRLLSKNEREKHRLDDEHIAYVGGVMMEAGSDSTSSTLLSFILAMVKHPEVLRKAQAEVDALVGDSHSPTYEDTEHLPYIRAIVDETLRWRPAVPAAFPHVLTQDDNFNGFHLPAGSMVIANVLAVHQNKKDFENPLEFHPERYLNNEMGTIATGNEKTGRRSVYTFGAGRRVCPGQHLGENSLRINISKLVWGFNFLPPIDPKTGKAVPVSDIDSEISSAYTDGVSTAPKPFKCRIVPRSAKCVEIIQREYEQAHVVFNQYHE
ncbi:hypothetical protein LTR95_007574 [Oleoguttula sp. CCFEE 5521]